MTTYTFSGLWVLALVVACSASDEGRSRSGGSGTAMGIDGMCTPAGMHTCVCSDGKNTGMQVCSPDGSLTPCMCPALVPGGTAGGGPSDGSPPPLCAELAAAVGCQAETFQSRQLPASVLFVVDRSGSMNCNLPPVQSSAECEASTAGAPKDPAQPSKWQVTVNALKDAFAQLEARSSTASLGLTFFSNDDICGVMSKPVVAVGPLTTSNVTTLAAILDGTQPGGGTPITGATILAYQHLHQEAGANIECPGPGCPCAQPPCGASGNRYVVLITDGQESCAANDAELAEWTGRLLDVEAPKAVKANVRTFVVGSPGSEPARGFLSELAFQGGTARAGGQCAHDRNSSEGDCHFDMTQTQNFAADLADVLESISGTALSCQFTVPGTLDSTGAANVNVQLTASPGGTPSCIARDESKPCDGGAEGWQFAKLPDGSADLGKVVVCGAACNMIESAPAARVDVLLGCESYRVD